MKGGLTVHLVVVAGCCLTVKAAAVVVSLSLSFIIGGDGGVGAARRAAAVSPPEVLRAQHAPAARERPRCSVRVSRHHVEADRAAVLSRFVVVVDTLSLGVGAASRALTSRRVAGLDVAIRPQTPSKVVGSHLEERLIGRDHPLERVEQHAEQA